MGCFMATIGSSLDFWGDESGRRQANKSCAAPPARRPAASPIGTAGNVGTFFATCAGKDEHSLRRPLGNPNIVVPETGVE
jgi:hypothetical protein